ncbi:hypothetical protein VT84_35720 [Gemmata sp. SH-PL17]|uniref:hypothetical protein n=1 Tax=Gemmata sp. SH-PL17 TaxID=1630693 RepID=UPI0004B97721|nr:hypothetical protein [Gemmata sp. SH-PL17]AMV29797.1 hypothetical protein VT84_35720 [Gemmata sp. SH-PL17]
MTAIGKLMAFLLLAVGLAMMTWALSAYAQRPAWFDPIPEGGVDKNARTATFAQLKAEIDALNRSAEVATSVWGTSLKELEASESLRAGRLKGYADRYQWARKGNPRDLIDPANPRSGKGFYAPTIDPALKLYDLSADATGKPKGAPLLGSDELPLPGIDMLTDSVSNDLKEMLELTAQITEQRRKFDELSADVVATEDRLVAVNTIRDSVQAELFFLSTFTSNEYETRETVARRKQQLQKRLRALGGARF